MKKIMASATDDTANNTATRYTPMGFWVGLPLVLLLAAACWMGVMHSAKRISTERAVYELGILTAGVVVEKIDNTQGTVENNTNYVAYEFQTPSGVRFYSKIRIDFAAFIQLEKNGPISIRYVPDKPDQNLPDGWHMTDYFYITGGLSLVGALFFSIVVIGILIKKLTGGYRGESHPFLGE